MFWYDISIPTSNHLMVFPAPFQWNLFSDQDMKLSFRKEMEWREITLRVNLWFVNKYVFKRFTSNSYTSNTISKYSTLLQIKGIFKLITVPL